MTKTFTILPLLAASVLAGCSQAEPSSSTESELSRERMAASDTTADASAAAGPGIAVTAAPGVAFDYRYAFRLPAERIAAIQEAHAQACEKIGTSRCRITGMRYTMVGDRRVEAMLRFKLDPALARSFGRQGIAVVTAADGMLTDAEITGTDAGEAIRAIDRSSDDLAEQLRRIDRELARPGLGARERAELQRQRADIETRIAAARTARQEQSDSLATTPVTFSYASGAAVRRFADDSPLTAALDMAVASAQATLSAVLTVAAISAPPALLAALLWWLWTLLRARLPRRRREAPPQAD